MALRSELKNIWVTNHKITQAEYWELFDSIWFKNENSVYDYDIVDISYNGLRNLVITQSLTNNTIYRIYDYKTVHFLQGMPSGSIGDIYESWNDSSAVEPLLVKADTKYRLNKVAISDIFEYRYDIIHYELDPFDDVDQCLRGKITFRRDPINKLEAHYDWRNFKFARWETVGGSGIFDSTTRNFNAYELYQTFNDPTVTHYNVTIGAGKVSIGNNVPRANNVVFLNTTSNIILESDTEKLTFYDQVSDTHIGIGVNNVKSITPVTNFRIESGVSDYTLPLGQDNVVAIKDGVISVSRYIPNADYDILATNQNADALHFHTSFTHDVNLGGNELQDFTFENVTSLPVTGLNIGRVVHLTTDSKSYVYRNSGWEYYIPSGMIAVANGIATLNSNLKVVQDPNSASTTATTTGIPKAVGGLIAPEWIPSLDTLSVTNKATNSIDANNQKIVNLLTPTLDSDAVTKLYVDQLIQGIKGKDSADVATTEPLSNILSAAPSGLDGIPLKAGYRVLVKDQTLPSENGIYEITTLGNGANGVWTRSYDANTWIELQSAYVFIEQGLTQADSGWLCIADADNGVLDTSDLNWVLFSNAGGLKQFIGTTNITTLGAITTGVWNATDVSLADGGTNASLVASNGGIFYSTASAGAILSGTPTAKRMLQSGANTTPSWSVATYPSTANVAGNILRADGTNWLASTLTIPDTTPINTVLYSSDVNTVSSLPTVNNGVLITNGTGVPSISTDITTAVTIGGEYIYRKNGTDVEVVDGGTGFSSYTVGDILTADTSTSLIKIPDVATGNVLISGGIGVVPSYGKVDLTAHVSNILPVENGGTGFATLQEGGVARKVAFDVGGSDTVTVTHNLGTLDCVVTIRENVAPYKVVYADIDMDSLNTVTVKFKVAPSVDQYRVIVIG